MNYFIHRENDNFIAIMDDNGVFGTFTLGDISQFITGDEVRFFGYGIDDNDFLEGLLNCKDDALMTYRHMDSFFEAKMDPPKNTYNRLKWIQFLCHELQKCDRI